MWREKLDTQAILSRKRDYRFLEQPVLIYRVYDDNLHFAPDHGAGGRGKAQGSGHQGSFEPEGTPPREPVRHLSRQKSDIRGLFML